MGPPQVGETAGDFNLDQFWQSEYRKNLDDFHIQVFFRLRQVDFDSWPGPIARIEELNSNARGRTKFNLLLIPRQVGLFKDSFDVARVRSSNNQINIDRVP